MLNYNTFYRKFNISRTNRKYIITIFMTNMNAHKHIVSKSLFIFCNIELIENNN